METTDTRNVIDEFKGLEVEEIRSKLSLRRKPFASLILNIDYDINIANIVRSHNAFCGQEIFYIGRRKYNRKGCVGTYLYENLSHYSDLDTALENIPKKYTWIGIDNIEGSFPMTGFDWPDNPLLVFGHEREGLDHIPGLSQRCDKIVSIPQLGSVRSLNVAVAAGITMYDFCLKKGFL